jgi:hypothetical protein
MRRLTIGQHVDVEGSSLARTRARVEERDEEAIVLGLAVVPPEPLRAQPVTIAFTAEGGLFRVAGDAEPADGARDLLRVLPAGELERLQRREHVRAEAVRPATVEFGPGEAIDTWTLNVSAGGVLLAGPARLRVGDSVWVRLRLRDGTPPIAVEGRVARETPEGFRAVRIEAILQQDREMLVRYVFQREREARRTRDG